MSRKALRSFTIVLFVTLFFAAIAHAQEPRAGSVLAPRVTFTVNSATDAGDAAPGNSVCATAGSVCTLRAAIQEANALAGDDIITLPAGTYTLTLAGAGEDAAATGDLDITSNLTLNGASAATTVIDGNWADRVLHVTGTFTVNISGVTVTHGDGSGGGIRNDGGALTITDSAISDNNSVADAGGVSNSGTLTITNSAFTSNNAGADAGGILNSGTLTIANSAFTSNNSGANAGGVLNSGALTITNSAFTSNNARTDGGVIHSSGTLTVSDSTFSDNNTGAGGGAIYSSGTLTVTHSIFYNNNAGSGGAINDNGGIAASAIHDSGSSTTIVTHSAFSENTASSGGAIYSQSDVTVANSTFSGNNASDGDDIYASSGAFAVTNSTIFGHVTDPDDASGEGNRPASNGSVLNSGATVTLQNTIVAGHESGGNCVGVITNGGNNLEDGTTCGWGSANGSMSSTNPLFEALTGSPEYFPLNAGSPALDAGNNAACAAAPVNNESQNGVTRPIDGDSNGSAVCDIGSYEASGQTIVPGDDWHIEYDGWVGAANVNASGGAFRFSNIKKNKAIFKFSGDAIKWITMKGPEQGIAQVFIDKKLKGTFDLYSPTVKSKVKKTFKGLGGGKHRLVVRVTGAKNAKATNTYVALDAFVVGAATNEESSPKVTYNYWKGIVNVNASSGALRMSKKSRSRAILTFTGTSVNWITATGPKYGNANVMIDGVDQGTFDLYSPTQQFQVVRTFGGLSAGQHTIQVRPLRTKNAASGGYWVVVDAFSGPITLPNIQK